MDYKQEEEHLQHADSSAGREQIIADMKSHFQSGGVQTEGDMNVIKHSTDLEAAPKVPLPETSQLAQELDNMAERHQAEGENGFVRGVAGLEFAYAEEEADAE